ncbi:Translation initiation factor IF-2, mitochondrial [Halocaridina rubra]|uniref:Translation initiation factor IF-2, mitochondrial n=1 Tax=Halocaridina rubra TaxID=373956 RepID=A0AAN8WZW6_HALRR
MATLLVSMGYDLMLKKKNFALQERCKRMLLDSGLQLEEQGGDVQAVPISALKAQNLDKLVEAIATEAEILNLRADPRGLVEAVVIEARTDPGRGKVVTCIIQRGTLRKGAVLVAGTAWGKVRNMFNDSGLQLKEAPPATPVQLSIIFASLFENNHRFQADFELAIYWAITHYRLIA